MKAGIVSQLKVGKTQVGQAGVAGGARSSRRRGSRRGML
jgi:hypothetical protein